MGGVFCQDETCFQCGYDRCTRYYNPDRYCIDIDCPRCGYSYRMKPKINRAQERKTGERWYLLDKSGRPIVQENERVGHAVSYISYKSGGALWASHSRGVGERMIEEFREILRQDDVDETRSFLARWDASAQRVRVMAGTWWEPFNTADGVSTPADDGGQGNADATGEPC